MERIFPYINALSNYIKNYICAIVIYSRNYLEYLCLCLSLFLSLKCSQNEHLSFH